MAEPSRGIVRCFLRTVTKIMNFEYSGYKKMDSERAVQKVEL
jgi:hypothetical protein